MNEELTPSNSKEGLKMMIRSAFCRISTLIFLIFVSSAQLAGQSYPSTTQPVNFSRLPKLPEQATAEQCYRFLMKTDLPEVKLAFGDDLQQLFSYRFPAYERYFKQTLEGNVVHPYLESTGKDYLKEVLFADLSSGNPMVKRYANSFWKVQAYSLDKVAEKEGKKSLDFLYALYEGLRFAQYQDDYEGVVRVFLESYELSRSFIPADDDYLLGLLEVASLYMQNVPESPFTQAFLKKYVPEIKANPALEAQRKIIEGLDKGLEQVAVVTAEREANRPFYEKVPSLSYPNALDSTLWSAASQLAGSYHKRLHLEVLKQCYINPESKIKGEGKRDGDALASFVVKHADEHQEITGDLLDFTLAREHFNTQLEIRNKLLDSLYQQPSWKPKHDELQRLEGETQEQSLRGDYLKIIETNAAIRTLQKELCQAATQDWEPPLAPTWKSLQRILEPEQALVVIHRYVPRTMGKWFNQVEYAAIILSSTGHPIVQPISGSDSLDYELFYDYVEENQRYGPGVAYERFWQPIAKHLSRIKQVYVAPDGIYHRLNLATLKVPGEDRYLLEEQDIRYLETPASLLKEKIDRSRLSSALLLGNPRFDPTSEYQKYSKGEYFRKSADKDGPGLEWAPLPGSQQEVEDCEKIIAKAGLTTTLLTDRRASKTELGLAIREPDILHFATHAYFSPFSLFEQPLVLAGNLPEVSGKKLSSNYPQLVNLEDRGRLSTEEAKNWSTVMEATFGKDDPMAALMPDEKQIYNMLLSSGIVLANANRPTLVLCQA